VFNHPNYTFSITDKQLYTLFKGTMITFGFVGPPACLRTVEPLYTRRLLSLLRTVPFIRV
jgi:hypothetical protein